MWYKHEEAIRRFSVFFNSVTLAGAFGGLLASGIDRMDGTQNYSGWRWIFIIEGILTIAVSVVSYFFITDFPETATWFSSDEKSFMRARTLEQDEDADCEISLSHGLRGYFSDYKSYLGALLYFGELPYARTCCGGRSLCSLDP